MDVPVKQEILATLNPETSRLNQNQLNGHVLGVHTSVIELSSSSSSSSDSDSDDDLNQVLSSMGRKMDGVLVGDNGVILKKRKRNELGVSLPLRFLSSVPLDEAPIMSQELLPLPGPEMPVDQQQVAERGSSTLQVKGGCKQFWKAGDYEGAFPPEWDSSSVGMDHVRVHPKFLHSNATSHKWALGAFAELLDNSIDEVCNGATYVNVDMSINKKDGSRMLLIEDNGGGMDPDKMRQCMSLGYSVKSKIANTIGQYGNGFKTSTMRLGADVIVFTRCCGKDGKSPTQSIGLLSYTFLRSTGKEDIVVPMLDFERGAGEWNRMLRSSPGDWHKNVETIVQWSPYTSEADLLRQFNMMKAHGTRIIIYNLWEDDQGQLELDFDADPHDIQIRGVNRDEKNIQMAKEFPNSRHFLTYRHSLRSYASILYLRLPPGFRIILRGKDVEHHNIVNDMMLSQEITYKPQPGAQGIPKDVNMVAVVTIGFVKDAKHHIDVQGFNVYHKNRLIKPFWRLWNASGSDGRGVIGVLEANFVEPAHDKQGFERTTVLARLESRLIQMQKTYWSSNCHKIGYAPRRNKKQAADEYEPREACTPSKSAQSSPLNMKGTLSSSKMSNLKQKGKDSESYRKNLDKSMSSTPKRSRGGSAALPSSPNEDASDDMFTVSSERLSKTSNYGSGLGEKSFGKGGALPDSDIHVLQKLKAENRELKERLERMERGGTVGGLLQDLLCEKEKCKSLETQLQSVQQKLEELNKEQESLIEIFSEERDRRDAEEKKLRRKIQELIDKIRLLENSKSV